MNESHQLAKTYTMLNPQGVKVTFTNMTQFCKENGLNGAALCNVANGYLYQHRGWTVYTAHELFEKVMRA